ncbi:MAG: hypothetical protein R3D27_02505 [Hyphomicrobiaceae bacterium]
MLAIEVQEHARKLYEALGAKAAVEAAQNAARLEEQGKPDEARDWRRIEAALAHMRGPRES